jgi:hypothetical protein
MGLYYKTSIENLPSNVIWVRTIREDLVVVLQDQEENIYYVDMEDFVDEWILQHKILCF